MSRKKTKIKPESAERLKIILDRENKTQTQLSKIINMSQQNISKIMQKKQALTDDTAQLIVDAFSDRPPEKRYRLLWLLGYDDYMTLEDMYREKQLQQLHDTDDLIKAVTDLVKLSGFYVETIDTPLPTNVIPGNTMPILLHNMLISRDGESVSLPLDDFREFGYEIRDYVEMRLKRMIKQCQF